MVFWRSFNLSHDSTASVFEKGREKSAEKLNEIVQASIDTNGFEADYYLSALFNIETSPGFRALDLIKRDIPEEK